MTIERRFVVSLNDIGAVVFECIRCKTRVAVSPDNIGPISGKCPRCSHTWKIPEQAEFSSESYITNFAKALGKIRCTDPQTIGFGIFLEFEEPKD
jgi:predicted Zn finger-like uncharacterized protein